MLPTDPKARKETPVFSGFLNYFPDAVAAVAELSRIGNDQHNPGKPLHWDRSKSGDELDALSRHLLEAGKTDTDGVRHSAKLAWRAMANLQKEIEAEEAKDAALSPIVEDPYIGPEGRVAAYIEKYRVSRTAAIDALGLQGWVPPY